MKIYNNILDRLDCNGTLREMVDQAREDKFDYPIRALRKPVYEITPNQTKVTFRSQIKEIMVVKIEQKILEGLNERQRKAIEYIRKSGKITRKKYEKLYKTSERTANRELRELIKKRIIRKSGSGVKFYYGLAS